MKKIFVLLLSGVMVITSLQGTQIAAADTVSTADAAVAIKAEDTAGSGPSQIKLTAVIKTVKGKIEIPEKYSEFDYYYYDASTYSKAYWNLIWRTKDGNASIRVNCDEDYHITYYRKDNYSQREAGISNYLKEELEDKAELFVTKTVPDTIGKLDYQGADFEGIYSGNYIYNYQRVENGIAFPDNTVKVGVNSISGEVTSLAVNWLYDEKVPEASAKLTKEEAAKLIRDNMEMKLVYRTNSCRIYDDTAAAGLSQKAYLVYVPSKSYLAVDAKTGEVYLTQSEWKNTAVRNEEAAADTVAAEGKNSSSELTSEEAARVEELKNLISKDKAIEIVTGNKYLYLDNSLIAYSVTLGKQKDRNGKISYSWNIRLSNPNEEDQIKSSQNYTGYAYASVDAQTSKIISFYASVKDYYNEEKGTWDSVKLQHDKKEARIMLEKFLKQQVNDRFKNSILSDTTDDYIAYYEKDTPVYGGYRYRYNRVNEGVEYSGNSIYGNVDAVTGKIYSFGCNWDDNIEFESPEGVISADEALSTYLSLDGYGLKYEINQINQYDSGKKDSSYIDISNQINVKNEVRLVYRPDITPGYISPFTGKQINADGSEYVKAQPYAYQDITDAAKYRNIFLLSDMGIGFEGDQFLPDQAITAKEMNELLEKTGYGAYTEDTGTDDSKTVTREEAAGYFINRLGLDKIAKLEGIYKTGYVDESQIDSQYLGAVALAKAYGLFEAESDNYFNPRSSTSRYDAVNLLLNYIRLQREGIY